MTMTLSGGKRTGFKVGSDYYHSVNPEQVCEGVIMSFCRAKQALILSRKNGAPNYRFDNRYGVLLWAHDTPTNAPL